MTKEEYLKGLKNITECLGTMDEKNMAKKLNKAHLFLDKLTKRANDGTNMFSLHSIPTSNKPLPLQP